MDCVWKRRFQAPYAVVRVPIKKRIIAAWEIFRQNCFLFHKILGN